MNCAESESCSAHFTPTRGDGSPAGGAFIYSLCIGLSRARPSPSPLGDELPPASSCAQLIASASRPSAAYTHRDTRADQSDELPCSPDHGPPHPGKAPSPPVVKQPPHDSFSPFFASSLSRNTQHLDG